MYFLKFFKLKKSLFLWCMALLLFFYTAILLANEKHSLKKEIILKGETGTQNGQIGFKVYESDATYEAIPTAIAVDTKGNIYIADIANERIQKFDKNGNFSYEINFAVKNKKFYATIDDIVTDNADNLYVASRHELKIDKYNSDGKLVQSVNLEDKDVCWSKKKGWHPCFIQIERMMIDVAGNIYLQALDSLIKFNPNGKMEKKWANARISFLDEEGNLYLSKADVWEKYDKSGNIIDTLRCEKPLFRLTKKGQCIYPQFIDQNGFLYFYEFYESGLTSKGNDRFVKVDRKGMRYGEYRVRIGPGNIDKFDRNGNFYSFGYKNDEFWVEKISWLN